MGIFLSRKMQYFMVLMDKKNFAKAAEELCITRSPLSKVLAEIEDTIGGKLFHRKHNELNPTELAWDYYVRCKQIYGALLTLENEHKISSQPPKLTFRFDISAPENFVRHIELIAKAENLNVAITREMITVDDLASLPHDKNQAIFSLRPLSGVHLFSSTTWEGSNLVEISSSQINKNDNMNDYFIWKDNNHIYNKNRHIFLLKERGVEPRFIEHNYDVSTLLLMVRLGKGKIITSEKFAAWYRTDDLHIEKLNNHVKCHLYHNHISNSPKTLLELKRIINLFT